MQQQQHQQQRTPQLGMHGGGAVAGPSAQHLGMSMGVNGPVTIPLSGSYNGSGNHTNGEMAPSASPLQRQMTPQQQQQQILQQQHHLREQQQRQILLNQQHQQQHQVLAQEAQRRSYPTLVHPTPGTLATANGGPSTSSTPQPINPIQAGLLRPQSQQAVHPQHSSPSAMSSNNPSPNAGQGYLPPRAVSAAASGHFVQPTVPYSIVSPASSAHNQQTPQRLVMAPPKLPASVTHQQMQQMQQQQQQQQQQQHHHHHHQQMLQHQHMQQVQRVQQQQAMQLQQQRLQREQALRGSFPGPGRLFDKRESVIGWSDAAADVQHVLTMDSIDLDHFNPFSQTAISEYAALLQCLPARPTNADHEPRLITANQLAPSSPLLQPGAGVLRLLEWSATMIRGPNRAELSYWRSFTDDFFVDGGGMSYTLASDEQEAPQKLFDIPASILPRWYQTMFSSGVTSITFSLPSCTESLVPASPPSPGNGPPESPWHGICVECPSASWTFHYPDGCRVICEGSVQAVLVPVADDSCLRFEYVDLVTSSFEEFLPRKSKHPSGVKLAELKVKLENSASASPEVEKIVRTDTSVNVQDAPQTEETTIWINEYGLTGKAMRCLEIAESLDLMRDLFAVTSSEGVGPSTILARAAQPKPVTVPNAAYPPQPYPPVNHSPGLSPDDDGNNGGQDLSSYTSSSMTVVTPAAQPTPSSAAPATLANGQNTAAQSPANPSLVPSSPATGGRKRKQLPETASEMDHSRAYFDDRQSSPTKRAAPSPSPTTRTRRALRNTPLA